MVISLINDVLDLIERGQDLYGWMRKRRMRSFASGISDISVPDVYMYVRNLYGDLDVLTGPNGPFPMALLELSPEAIEEPETLTNNIVRRRELQLHEPRIIEAIKQRGSSIWNGDTFSLDRVHFDRHGRVSGCDAYIGDYYSQVCSAGYLEYELLAAISKGDIPRLPARGRLIREAGSPMECLLSGGGIDATMAISTLTVYKRDGQYWMLCEVRSKRVAEYGELYHVVPSFIFQPVVAVTPHNLLVEWSVRHNIYREYLEEIFNMEEVELGQNKISPNYFMDHPNLQFLQSLEKAGSARLFGTGFAFNLLNHRPEILTVLIIDDELWWEQQATMGRAAASGLKWLQLNNEFSSGRETHLESVTTLPLTSPGWGRVLKPWSMVPPAAPALVLGTKKACEVLGIQEPDWLEPFGVDRAHV